MSALATKNDTSHLKQGYRMAMAAHAAYFNDPMGDYPELADSFSTLQMFRGGRVSGFVASNDTEVVVAFRGTDEFDDWRDMVLYSQIEHGAGRVHKGISQALEHVWDTVLAAFYDVEADRKDICLTGHSLGGSFAVVAAHRLEDLGFEPGLVCTFGSPRALGPRAAKAFKTRAYRFVNNEDMVPGIPWPTPFDSYEHVGRLVFLLPSGDVAEDRHSVHLARRLDRANHIGEGIPPAGFIHDHLMENYLAKLKRYA